MNLDQIRELLDFDSDLLGPMIFFLPWLFRFVRGLLKKGTEESSPSEKQAQPSSAQQHSAQPSSAQSNRRSVAERLGALRQAVATALQAAGAEDDQDELTPLPEASEQPLAEPSQQQPPRDDVPSAWNPSAARAGSPRIDAKLIISAVHWEAALSPRRPGLRMPPRQ